MKSSSFPRASLLIIAAIIIIGLFDMAAAVTITNFTKLNPAGACADSQGHAFTRAFSEDQTYTTDTAMENYCVFWCGQHLPVIFRGFDTFHNQGTTIFSCDCLFDLPTYVDGHPHPYTYTPAADLFSSFQGTGAVMTTAAAPGRQCYKFNGNATEAPTKAPTKPGSCPVGHPACITRDDCSSTAFAHCVNGCCANLPTDSPTKAPTKLATNVPTKAPTKPSSPASNAPTKKPAGSCPVGHPICVNAAGCSGTGFSHCVDGCCANIGSKSAKGTKSSKSV